MILPHRCQGRGYPNADPRYTVGSAERPGPQAMRIIWTHGFAQAEEWNGHHFWLLQDTDGGIFGLNPVIGWHNTTDTNDFFLHAWIVWRPGPNDFHIEIQIVRRVTSITVGSTWWKSADVIGFDWPNANVVVCPVDHTEGATADIGDNPLQLEIGYYNRMPAGSCPGVGTP